MELTETFFIQNTYGNNEYFIPQELLSGCDTKERIVKRLFEIQEEFAARRYVIMGYDKDSDKLYLMQASDTLSEATALAKSIWETNFQRTDTNREHNGVPDLDWFELYKQDSGNIDYSQRLAVFYGNNANSNRKPSFAARFDENASHDICEEIEKAVKNLTSIRNKSIERD